MAITMSDFSRPFLHHFTRTFFTSAAVNDPQRFNEPRTHTSHARRTARHARAAHAQTSMYPATHSRDPVGLSSVGVCTPCTTQAPGWSGRVAASLHCTYTVRVDLCREWQCQCPCRSPHTYKAASPAKRRRVADQAAAPTAPATPTPTPTPAALARPRRQDFVQEHLYWHAVHAAQGPPRTYAGHLCSAAYLAELLRRRGFVGTRLNGVHDGKPVFDGRWRHLNTHLKPCEGLNVELGVCDWEVGL